MHSMFDLPRKNIKTIACPLKRRQHINKHFRKWSKHYHQDSPLTIILILQKMAILIDKQSLAIHH